MIKVAFPFENVSGPTSGSLRHGIAHYKIDGLGVRECTSIEIFARVRSRSSYVLLPGSEKFTEMSVMLEAERRDDIDAHINEVLERGGNMALFGRNRPPSAQAA